MYIRISFPTSDPPHAHNEDWRLRRSIDKPPAKGQWSPIADWFCSLSSRIPGLMFLRLPWISPGECLSVYRCSTRNYLFTLKKCPKWSLVKFDNGSLALYPPDKATKSWGWLRYSSPRSINGRVAGCPSWFIHPSSALRTRPGGSSKARTWL